jgi:DASS family divalent anion:Na+ symporter
MDHAAGVRRRRLTWLTTVWHGLDVTLVALIGWRAARHRHDDVADAASERSAWDVFVWYGGMLRMGELLNNTGSTRVFAEHVAACSSAFPGRRARRDPDHLLLLALLLRQHHRAHAGDVPAVRRRADRHRRAASCCGLQPDVPGEPDAGLTHYGTTTGPILFGTGYVTRREWWRVGFYVSLANVLIWLTAGFAWWKFLGFW